MNVVWCLGGLGNQMFQHAFYRAIELSGHDAYLDISGFKKYGLHNGFELYNTFNLRPRYAHPEIIKKIGAGRLQNFLASKGLSNRVFIQNYFGYQPLNFTKDRYWRGYWQSEKFFSNFKDDIKKDFMFVEHSKESKKISDKINRADQAVSIHVRRGDYINNKLYADICSIHYFKRATELIESMIPNPSYFIFSDDIDWCKQNLNYSSNVTYISPKSSKNSFRDMQLMSECHHNIISNSSFSWWGAWLNKNHQKKVIAPNKWFNNPNIYSDDIVPKDWITIKTG